MPLWVARARKRREREGFFLEHNVVVVGWDDVPDLSGSDDRDQLLKLLADTYSDENPKRVKNWETQLWAFTRRFQKGITHKGSQMTAETEHRQIVYRLHPGSRERAPSLASVAGACRFVWNEMLDQQERLYVVARMCGSKPPSPSFFTLGKAFTQLRRMTPWLQEMLYAPVRYTLKHQADAWQRYFRGQAGRHSAPTCVVAVLQQRLSRFRAVRAFGWRLAQRICITG